VRISSRLFGIARNLVRLAEEKQKPNENRLREYNDAALDRLYMRLFSPAPIYDDLEINSLESSLSFMAERFGYDDPAVQRALAGQSPRARAEQLVLGTKLKDVDVRKKLAEAGTAEIAASNDPLIMLAAALDPEARKLRKRYEDGIQATERDAYAKIAAARFAVFGETVYPDATFTLRLAYGPVTGYRENNEFVKPLTTFAGLYKRHAERKGEKGFELDQRWLDRKHKLDLDVPFNFVNTADIIGGNSGSPVIDTKGEVVGLIFDGNLHSLVFDVGYSDKQARSVAVDSRGIIEAMRKIYDANALADELLRG